MECISVFDMLKIGVGPSSSHTLGPWRAGERWIAELKEEGLFEQVTSIKVHVYGSLSLTGKGHATDLAILLGLSGADPEYIPIDTIDGIVNTIKTEHIINLNGARQLDFNFKEGIVFHRDFLPFHANGLTFEARLDSGATSSETYYSIGGGFVVKEELIHAKENLK